MAYSKAKMYFNIFSYCDLNALFWLLLNPKALFLVKYAVGLLQRT